MKTVPRETLTLLPTPLEGAPTSPVGVNALADARAEAPSWYLENRCAGRGRYPEHLMETEGKTMTTARMRLAAITAPTAWADTRTRPRGRW